MTDWSNSKLGRKANLGILHLGLMQELPDRFPSWWELFLYLRPGVTLGITSGHAHYSSPSAHVPRIARIKFSASSLFDAQADSERLAQKWLDAHLEELIAGDRFSV